MDFDTAPIGGNFANNTYSHCIVCYFIVLLDFLFTQNLIVNAEFVDSTRTPSFTLKVWVIRGLRREPKRSFTGDSIFSIVITIRYFISVQIKAEFALFYVVCVVLISASISRSVDEHKAHKISDANPMMLA